MFDPVQAPPLGHAFELVNAAILKADSRLRHQILDRARNQDFAGTHHVESWSDMRSDSLIGQLAKDAESQDKLRSKFFVYRKDDLISLRNEIAEFWGAVFRFALFLQTPSNQKSAEEFQKLYT